MPEILNTDQLIHALVFDGNVRLIAVSGTYLTERARSIHRLSRVATAAMGRQLMMTVMMASDQKGKDELVTTVIKGNGPAGSMIATGKADLSVKGYVANGSAELPPNAAGKLDVGGFVGSRGTLTVVRDLTIGEPYVGTCDLVSGELAQDFAAYYAYSLQQPSIVYLGVHEKVDTGRVTAASGLLLQPLPGCPDHLIDLLSEKTEAISTLTGKLESGLDLMRAVCEVLGVEALSGCEIRIPGYRCDCSRARIERALISTGTDTLREMIEQDHGAEVVCEFCEKKYRFSSDDLENLIAEARPDENE